jgi:hypothetical protein
MVEVDATIPVRAAKQVPKAPTATLTTDLAWIGSILSIVLRMDVAGQMEV